MKIISRDEALAQGLRYYFTGKPCSYGHVAERRVCTWGCRECATQSKARKRAARGAIPWSRTEEERKQRRAVTLKKYNEAHPERLIESSKRYRANNPEKRRATCKKWADANPENIRLRALTRLSRKRGNGGVLSKDLIPRLLKLQKGLCACCARPLGDDYQLDHRIPVVKGGPNEDWNMQLLLGRCNREKGARDPVEFMQLRGFLL